MLKYLSYVILILGMLVLLQGAIAFYFRINIFTGTRYGPSLMPIYIIFSGIGVCVLGLIFKSLADLMNRKR
jgi:hypothetical protein